MRKQKYSITDKNEITDFLNDSSGITIKLPFNPPFDWPAMIGFLAGRAIPGADRSYAGTGESVTNIRVGYE